MKVLVTGSQGWIGTYLTKYLESLGEEVILYDLEVGRDIFNDWQLNHFMRQADLVIHLAGCTGVPISYQIPFDFYRVNTEGAARVFRTASKYKLKVIHASTGEVYTRNSPYAASKIGAEAAAEVERVTNGLDVVILRFLNPYGPGQPNKYVIPLFIEKALQGQSLTIHGSGDQRKDYIYIDDLVKAIWISKALKSGTVSDLGCGTTTSINGIAHAIKEVMEPLEVKIEHSEGGERPGEIMDLKGNMEPLYELGWKPEVDLITGVDKVRQDIMKKYQLKPLVKGGE